MQIDLIKEAERQAHICNSCRYCEGYCSVFPALHAQRAFSEGDLTQFANLCHNCRGCYYACQYSEPHEFAINLPQILADVRKDSWEEFAYPSNVARTFQSNGLLIVLATLFGFALIFAFARWLGQSFGGEGFYAVMSHNIMVAIFMPAFFFPLLSIAISLRRYWAATGGGSLQLSDIFGAFSSVAKMKNLSGGHGDGCNFEDEDRFTHSRRLAHQAIMYGFLLCFASTSTATLMHYLMDWAAPYSFWSLPKLLGVSGGIILSIGSVWMVYLKNLADKNLGATSAWGGEMAFIFLLGFVAITGLALYVFGKTYAMPSLLAVHLGSVLSFFLLTPYTKMAHGFYRLTALVKDEQRKRNTQ